MAERRTRTLRVEPDDRPLAGREPPPSAQKPARAPKPAPRGGGPGRGLLIRGALLLVLWGLILGAGGLAWIALSLPPTGELGLADRRPSVTLLAADGSLIATFGDLFGEPLRLKDMPAYLPQAVIATEDRRFYSHFGIDPVGLARAAFTNFRAGHVVQGGSTVTQQLAKNLFLTPDRTFMRKLQECLLALWLEHKFTKDQILEIYLNRVYLGAGTYGVDAAAHRYFDKSARQLSLYEAAVIAGLLKAPTRFSPARDRERAAQRAEQVLANMVEAGYLTEAQAAAAGRQKTELALAARTRPGTRYFADWVAGEVQSIGAAQGRDVVVVTTLDPRLQAAGEQAIVETLNREGDKSDVEQGALVAMGTDGAVRAMVGGRDYGESQFNRATQALRQPGSSFKPFVYLAGLEHGLRPGDHLLDQPIRIGKWQPHNYENKYRGDVTLAEALAQSLNTVAAQVLLRAGVDNVIAAAHRLGITAELTHDASLALGTSEVSLIELTAAYAAFASGGTGAWPYGVVEIRDNRGNPLWRRSGSGPGQVIDPAIAGEMNQMLAGVLTHGTGKSAQLDRPAAGKTGTTQDFHDALFVGYTADLVAGVWFGNDDNAPMKHVTGGTLPARSWHAFMAAATQGMPVRPLPQPAAPAAMVASAVAPPVQAAGGWLRGLLDSIFSDDRPAPAQRPRETPWDQRGGPP
jgi:penicillin-binding protein 1A